ncbi:D-alanyl-D-alanine carboxypeptidase family protein [Halobacillus salinus]|uniref:D-alanyl-D-alanine carboxypeptidase family protein n=2 Tax=Halobacillus salinus TaxID=192814 RepID=A0A4Z0H7Z3_9BACI|nr:D-alanyl-D-alanine carboxypeptidase family protein [Halobacillus salinus]
MTMKKYLVVAATVVTLSACSVSTAEKPEKTSEATPVSQKAPKERDVAAYVEKQPIEKMTEDGLTIVHNPESIEVVVNKQRTLPEGYTPDDLVVPDVAFYFDQFLPKKQMRKEAAGALETLFAAAEKDGQKIVAASGYRSYERQKTIFNNYVEVYGEEETKTFSAVPGTSEHQTGLAMDVTSREMSYELDQSFRQTTEGKWLAEHAYEYGFVIRYPKGKDDITGYTYEPWHLRYVGKEKALEIHKQSMTLEEFFGYMP